MEIVQTFNFFAKLDGHTEEHIGHVAAVIQAADIAELARVLSNVSLGASNGEFFLVSLGVRLEHPFISWDVPTNGLDLSDIRVAFGDRYPQVKP